MIILLWFGGFKDKFCCRNVYLRLPKLPIHIKNTSTCALWNVQAFVCVNFTVCIFFALVQLTTGIERLVLRHRIAQLSKWNATWRDCVTQDNIARDVTRRSAHCTTRHATAMCKLQLDQIFRCSFPKNSQLFVPLQWTVVGPSGATGRTVRVDVGRDRSVVLEAATTLLLWTDRRVLEKPWNESTAPDTAPVKPLSDFTRTHNPLNYSKISKLH